MGEQSRISAWADANVLIVKYTASNQCYLLSTGKLLSSWWYLETLTTSFTYVCIAPELEQIIIIIIIIIIVVVVVLVVVVVVVVVAMIVVVVVVVVVVVTHMEPYYINTCCIQQHFQSTHSA